MMCCPDYKDARANQKCLQQYAFLPLLVSEFSAVSREFPIVFAERKGIILSFALVIKELESAFNSVTDTIWHATYAPIVVREHPFGHGRSLCDDRGTGYADIRLHPQYGTDQNWLQDLLVRKLILIDEYQKTIDFCQTLLNFGVLNTAVAFTPSERTGVDESPQFLVVSQERMSALPDHQFGAMVRNGDMQLCNLHLGSLGKADMTIRHLSHRRPPEAATTSRNDGFVPWRERGRPHGHT